MRLTVLRPAKEEDTPDLKYVPLPGVKEDSGAAGGRRLGDHHRRLRARAAAVV